MPEPRGFAMQVRINMETMAETGATQPAGGTLTAFDPPSGPGVRVDSFGYTPDTRTSAASIRCSPSSSSTHRPRAAATWWRRLLARCANSASMACRPTLRSCRRAGRARFRRQPYQHALHRGATSPRWSGSEDGRASVVLCRRRRRRGDVRTGRQRCRGRPDWIRGGARAVARYRRGDRRERRRPRPARPADRGHRSHENGAFVIAAPWRNDHGDRSQRRCDADARRSRSCSSSPPRSTAASTEEETTVDLDHIRPDLAEVIERHALSSTRARPEAVARRRKTGQRTARENIDDLCRCRHSFVEYGPLAIAAQRAPPHDRGPDQEYAGRRPGYRHRRASTAICSGTGTRACVVMSYDYTVLAGTQGQHEPQEDRPMFELAEQSRLPVVLFSRRRRRPARRHRRGSASTGLDCPTFILRETVSGLVPLVGINSGRCFAGNAALLGCCDVIIATQGSPHRHGRAGDDRRRRPGVYPPGRSRPDRACRRQWRHRYSGRGRSRGSSGRAASISPTSRADAASGTAPTSACCARAIPENRLRVYDVRAVIETLADTGSVLELRARFRPRHDHRASSASKAARSDSSPTIRCISAARSTPTAPTRPRASCSCATPSTFRIAVPVRHAGHHGRPRGREDRAGAPRLRGCSSPAPTSRVPFFTSCCARATGSARRRWRAAASRRRSSRLHGRPASSAAWGWKACAPGLPQGNGSDRRSGRARKILQGQGRATLRQRQGGLDRLRARDRRGNRSGGNTALDHGGIAVDAGGAASDRTQTPLHRCVVRSDSAAAVSSFAWHLPKIIRSTGPGRGAILQRAVEEVATSALKADFKAPSIHLDPVAPCRRAVWR